MGCFLFLHLHGSLILECTAGRFNRPGFLLRREEEKRKIPSESGMLSINILDYIQREREGQIFVRLFWHSIEGCQFTCLSLRRVAPLRSCHITCWAPRRRKKSTSALFYTHTHTTRTFFFFFLLNSAGCPLFSGKRICRARPFSLSLPTVTLDFKTLAHAPGKYLCVFRL